MPKNLFQDMVKVKRMRNADPERTFPSSLNDIRRVEKVERPIPPVVPPPTRRENVPPPRMSQRNIDTGMHDYREDKGGSRMIWVVAIVAILFFLFSLSLLFTKATVTVNPKTKEVTLNEDLTAIKESTKDGDLPFDLVAISGQVDKLVKNSQLADIAIPAKGTIIMYNAYNDKVQKLDMNTRLEGSNGKIYKTETAVTIPGKTGNTPGSVEVVVDGAVPGADYNSAPLDFKIMGFKGGPKYEKFYARSKTPLTGGFVGKSPSLSDADKATLHTALVLALKESLLQKVTSQIPQGFILFQNAVSLNSENETFAAPKADGSVIASMKGTLYGVLFNEQKLTTEIATKEIDGYDGSNVYIPDLKNAVFTMTSSTNFAGAEDVASINFNLSGPIKIVYRIDEDALRADLLGKSKDEFNQILANYKDIESAKSTISPFWKSSFPDQTSKIKILVNY